MRYVRSENDAAWLVFNFHQLFMLAHLKFPLSHWRLCIIPTCWVATRRIPSFVLRPWSFVLNPFWRCMNSVHLFCRAETAHTQGGEGAESGWSVGWWVGVWWPALLNAVHCCLGYLGLPGCSIVCFLLFCLASCASCATPSASAQRPPPNTHTICPGPLLLAFVNVNNLICLVGVIFAINNELWVWKVWVCHTMTIDNGQEAA